MTFNIDIHHDDEIHEFLVEQLTSLGWKIDINAQSPNSYWGNFLNQTARFFQLDLKEKRMEWFGGEFADNPNEDGQWDSLTSDEEAIALVEFIKVNYDVLVEPPIFSKKKIDWDKAVEELETAKKMSKATGYPVKTADQNPCYETWLDHHTSGAPITYQHVAFSSSGKSMFAMEQYVKEIMKKKMEYLDSLTSNDIPPHMTIDSMDAMTLAGYTWSQYGTLPSQES